MNSPRIVPLEPPYVPEITAEFDRVMPPGVPPLLLFRAVGVNPRVLSRMMAGGLLDPGSITLRQREIVIQRTCFLCRSEYEWGVHVAFFGPKAGFTDEDVRAICSDSPEAAALPDAERLLLRLADELHRTATVGDGLWAELERHYTSPQLVEIVVLVGLYHAVSFTTNALRLPNEPFGAKFPAGA